MSASDVSIQQPIEDGSTASALPPWSDAYWRPRLTRIVLLPNSPRHLHLADNNQTSGVEPEGTRSALEVWHERYVQPMTESELRRLEATDWIVPTLAG